MEQEIPIPDIPEQYVWSAGNAGSAGDIGTGTTGGTGSRKRRLWPFIVVGVIAVVLIAAIVVACVVWYSTRDARRLLAGMQNLAAETREMQEDWAAEAGNTAFSADTSFNFSTSLLPVTVGIDTVLARDTDAQKMQLSTDFSVMNYNFLSLDAYAEGNQLTVSLPDFFEENFTFSTERIDRQYNDSIFSQFGGSIDQEISINLFPEQEADTEENLTWAELLTYISDALSQRKQDGELPSVTFEKIPDEKSITVAEKDDAVYDCTLYRIVIPAEWISLWMEEGQVGEDIPLLVALSADNRILEIALEEPLCLDALLEGIGADETEEGAMWLTVSVYFLGEEYSLEDVVMRYSVTDSAGDLLSSDTVSSIIERFADGDDTAEVDSDVLYMELAAEMAWNKNDTSVSLDIDHVTMVLGDRANAKLTGSLKLTPLSQTDIVMAAPTGETLSLFELNWSDLLSLGSQFMKKAGGWLSLLSYFQ